MVAAECHVRVGRLAGNLGPGDQVHVAATSSTRSRASRTTAALLRFECAFVPFAGVPLGPDGAQTQY